MKAFRDPTLEWGLALVFLSMTHQQKRSRRLSSGLFGGQTSFPQNEAMLYSQNFQALAKVWGLVPSCIQ